MAGMLEDRSIGGVIRAALDARQEQIFTALPGRVVHYDAAKQVADVQPTLKRPVRRADGSTAWEELPILPSVPVLFLAAGGFRLTLPVEDGDPVLVLFTMRAHAEWRRTGEVSEPGDRRLHHLSGAVAIPGLLTEEGASNGAHASHAVLGTTETAIHVTPSEVLLGSEGAVLPVGRVGDAVTVTATIPAGAVMVPNPTPGGEPIPSPAPIPITASGVIAAGSPKVKAD
jgi:hypothetical protein